MADIAWSDVTGKFPNDAALAATPVGAQTDILAYVNAELSASFFGGASSAKFKLARIYMAAHMATSDASGGGAAAAGPLIEESLPGPVTRKYASPAAQTSDDPLELTSYGRMYVQLRKTSAIRFGVA